MNFARSIVGSGLIVFIPLYWAHVLMQPESISSLMLTFYSGSGAIATFFGGRIADKVGFKKMIVICFSLFAPILALFVLTANVILAAALIVLASLALSAAYSPIIALSQQYLPNRVGLASGISLGVVVSVGGISAPVIGAVGDSFGLVTSMSVIVVVAFIALALAVVLLLVKDKSQIVLVTTETKVADTTDAPAERTVAEPTTVQLLIAEPEEH